MTSRVSHVNKDSSLRNTKEHIATHTNLILPLYTPVRTLVIKCFKSSSCFEPKFLLQHYRPVLFYRLRNPHGMPTFKTDALRLVSNVQLIKQLLLSNEQQIQCYLALLWQ